MIKPNELRIGSYYKFQHITGRLQSFKSNDIVELYVNDRLIVKSEYEDLEPIPLSEEWLLKCGFEKGFAGYRIKGIKKMGRWITRKKFIGDERLSIPFLRFDGLVDIYSVHQLQNLVHSLTGEELTVKQEG